MDDVLSRGGDREPGRWPGRLAVIAVLVVLAVVIVRHPPAGRAAPAHRPAAVVAVGPVQLAGLGSAAAGLLDQAKGITGPALPGGRQHPASGHRRAARLVLAGHRPRAAHRRHAP